MSGVFEMRCRCFSMDRCLERKVETVLQLAITGKTMGSRGSEAHMNCGLENCKSTTGVEDSSQSDSLPQIGESRCSSRSNCSSALRRTGSLYNSVVKFVNSTYCAIVNFSGDVRLLFSQAPQPFKLRLTSTHRSTPKRGIVAS